MSPALLDRAHQQRLPGTLTRLVERSLDDASRAMAGGSRRGLRVWARGTPTLDQLITTSWRDLAVGESVRCPVCHGRMTAGVARAGHADGCCLDCGATLA